MNIFGQTFRRLLRIPRSYGFGVQSPFAYEFVRCVVNEKYPYYAYEELYDREAVRDKTELKRCRLCLRLANYIQASSWGIALEKNQRYEKYINAGCRKTIWTWQLSSVIDDIAGRLETDVRFLCRNSYIPIRFAGDEYWCHEGNETGVAANNEWQSDRRYFRPFRLRNRVLRFENAQAEL